MHVTKIPLVFIPQCPAHIKPQNYFFRTQGIEELFKMVNITDKIKEYVLWRNYPGVLRFAQGNVLTMGSNARIEEEMRRTQSNFEYKYCKGTVIQLTVYRE